MQKFDFWLSGVISYTYCLYIEVHPLQYSDYTMVTKINFPKMYLLKY